MKKNALGRVHMKLFTKVALVSAVAISSNAMAMQAMDDAALSATTGQDGISIGVKLGSGGLSIGKVLIHDNDGLAVNATTGGTGKAGAIVLGKDAVAGVGGAAGTPAVAGIKLTQTDATKDLATLVIDTDAGDATKGGAFLNVAANITGMKAEVGPISVAASGTKSGITRGTTGTANEILSGLTLTLGDISANVQLGATPQGAMINLDTTITGGLVIDKLGIKDAAGGGQIFLDKIEVATTGTNNLAINAGVSVKSTGIEIKPNAMNIGAYITGVHLGTQTGASIGDVEIAGLNLSNSTIRISGH